MLCFEGNKNSLGKLKLPYTSLLPKGSLGNPFQEFSSISYSQLP